ncbi:HET-domain-containing protein, partial [Lentithecium fluviatile CBS 122367]
EIRLLKIHPGAWSDPIQYDIEIVSLAKRHVYSALSYVWGTTPESYEIYVGGVGHAVKPNLYTALRRIRAHTKDDISTLWVDALCIDQSNTRERNHQVALVGEIYSKCVQCFIWL